MTGISARSAGQNGHNRFLRLFCGGRLILNENRKYSIETKGFSFLKGERYGNNGNKGMPYLR